MPAIMKVNVVQPYGESVKSILKKIAGKVPIETLQRLLVYSILEQAFPQLGSSPVFEKKEDLWDYCLDVLVGGNNPFTYVEFGVHEGYSITHFANKNKHSESCFIGLDSFEGLPEQWAAFPKGYFSTNGNIPHVPDSRVTFIKGWFQDTSDDLYEVISNRDNFVIHFDADLYSSTLFALTMINRLRNRYLAIFDEFTGHEARALYNYVQSHNARVQFLGKTLAHGYPNQVLCEIIPG